MKRTVALVALIVTLMGAAPSHATTTNRQINWTAVGSTTWYLPGKCTGFDQVGIVSGPPFSGALQDDACMGDTTLDASNSPRTHYSGFWIVRGSDFKNGLWGTFEFTTGLPTLTTMLDGVGTFTITGGYVDGTGCGALICPFPSIGGSGVVHVHLPWGSAAYLTFLGTLTLTTT